MPRPEPKYFLLGPELTVFTGVTKRMPSGVATTPAASKLQCGLKINQAGIGADQRFCPEVILFYPAKPVARQRRYIVLYQRFQPDIAGLCHQDRAQADVQILCPGPGFTDMRKLTCKSRSGIYFKQQFRQIYWRE